MVINHGIRSLLVQVSLLIWIISQWMVVCGAPTASASNAQGGQRVHAGVARAVDFHSKDTAEQDKRPFQVAFQPPAATAAATTTTLPSWLPVVPIAPAGAPTHAPPTPIVGEYDPTNAHPPPSPPTQPTQTQTLATKNQQPTFVTVPTTPTQTAKASLLAFHQHEYDKIQLTIDELTSQLQASQAHLVEIDHAIALQWQLYDDQFESVMQSALPSPRGAKLRNLKCMGWKTTQNCRWTGQHDPEGDTSCFSIIQQQDPVGYCVVRDDDSDEYFRVMKSDCNAVSQMATFSCRLAPAFANFPAEIEMVLDKNHVDLRAYGDSERATTQDVGAGDGGGAGDGIVVVVLASQVDQADLLVRALRSLGCSLPIELWYFEDEMARNIQQLQRIASSVPGETGVVTLRSMSKPLELAASRLTGMIFAVAHSGFSQVLYLDVATMPLQDPSYLFTLREFTTTGALFWPDLFHPETTQSNIQHTSLLWEYLDLPYISMFEQDDRQLLICKDHADVKRALRVLELFAPQNLNFFDRLKLVEDGKDLFRLAWLKAQVPFHMNVIPPALGGSAFVEPPHRFCGSHVIQYDPMGKMLFLHKQRDSVHHSARGGFTYLQSFDWRPRGTGSSDMASSAQEEELMSVYNVQSFPASEEPSDLLIKCYRFASDVHSHGRITTQLWRSVPEAMELQQRMKAAAVGAAVQVS